jgi:O-antigen ligase
MLLFVLIAEGPCNTQHTRLLYFTFSLVGLGLAAAVLWTAWSNKAASPQTWVSAVGSPVLFAPNDCIFLALIAPFSLALLYREPRRTVAVLPGLSLLLSVFAICILRSRGAVLTFIVSATCTGAFVRPRLGLIYGLGVFVAALLVDGLLGFPLITKFGLVSDPRISVWLIAWAMFLDAPLLGHGSHTFVLLYRSYLGHLPNWAPLDPHYSVPWAHNLYLEVLAEQGIGGLTILVLLLACGVWAAWTIRRNTMRDMQVLNAGALAGLLSFCFAALFELSFIRQWVVITLFSLLAVIAQLSRSQTRKEVFQ